MAELSIRQVTRWHAVTVLLDEPYPVSDRRSGGAPLPVVAVDLSWRDGGQLAAVTLTCPTDLGSLLHRPYLHRDRPGWLQHLIDRHQPSASAAVAEAVASLHDLTDCVCSDRHISRNLVDPDCHHQWREDVDLITGALGVQIAETVREETGNG